MTRAHTRPTVESMTPFGGVSTRREVLAGAAGLALVGLTGCLSVRAGPVKRDVTITVRNDDDRTNAVTVALLEGDENGPAPFGGVRLRYADGSERVDDADTLDEIPVELLANLLSVRPIDAVAVQHYPTVRPGTEILDTLDGGEAAWVVYVAAVPGADEPLRTFGQVTCLPNQLTTFEVDIQDAERVAVNLGCQGTTD